jgi:protoporphyrinogen oxidase
LKKNIQSESYNDYFIYPKHGSFEFVKSLLKRIDNEKIKVETELVDIDCENKVAKTNHGEIRFEKLINTTPFSFFHKLTTNEDINFTNNKVVVFNMGFDKKTTIKNNWIYFPGDEIFYRVGFYNNIFEDQNMSLYVEISVSKNEKVDELKLLERIIFDLKKTKLIIQVIIIKIFHINIFK